jgi:hypothetical protein
VLSVAAGFVLAGTAPSAFGQSKSGFTYNGMDYISYEADEYLETPQGPTGTADLRETGANYTAVMATWYVQTYDSTSIAPDSSSPTDAAVVAAIQNLQAQGITVTLKPHVDSLDGIWRGDFTWPTADTTTAEQQAWLTAWFTSYQAFILHFAQIASENNVGVMVIGTEFAKLTGNTCAGSCRTYWDEYVINPLRAKYPNLTLAYGANAASAGDEFTTVTFWDDVDIIGVDGYFPLTNHADPTVAQLTAAWTTASGNTSGFAPELALKNLQSSHPSKPLIFTELGYTSTAGTNEAPYNFTPTGSFDLTEQEDCYEAFFEVFSQETSWMKGIFWWDWSVSPPGANDTGYSPQTKPAGTTTLPEWYGSTTAGFTLAPSIPAIFIGQGLNSTDTISVTPLGGFTGTVTLGASGLPSGVTAAFTAGTVAGTQVLTLTASGAATLAGPVGVTITGTSGALTATTTVSLTVQAAIAQTITFANPGDQEEGTQLTLMASATSGLPVSFASTTTSICTVNNSTGAATLITTGTCTLNATQAGNGIYSAAPQVQQSFAVTSLPPVPVPSSADVIVSQVNWLYAVDGYVQSSNNPTGGSFGVNAFGEIAVAGTSESNDIYLVNAQTGAAITLGEWQGASATAFDSKNNLYAGSLYGSPESIVKLPYVGGAANGGYAAFSAPTTSTPSCTSSSTTECVVHQAGSVYPEALAFDAAGDLFWITEGNGDTAGNAGNSIWECNAACLAGTGTAVELYQEPTASPAPSTSSGQLIAGGLAIDSAGNIFFTDSSTYVNATTYGYTSFYSNIKELPVSAGVGYGGMTTGYAASPAVLMTLTPTSIGPYNDEFDAVTVIRNATAGDTVYSADQSYGVFAFPDSSGGIPIANGQPTALYMVSTQGAKTLTADSQGNLYLAASSAIVNKGGADTLAQLTVDNVTVPVSPVGTPVSPSATLNPVTTILNDVNCAGSPSVRFVAATSTAAAATVATTGSCSPTFTNGSTFDTAVSFTPSVAGADTISLIGTDQSSNAGTVTVSGIGSGFTLSPSAPAISVAEGSSNTDTITVGDAGGFTGAVTLTATGLPTGVTAGFATNPTTGSSVLTLTALSTATLGGPVPVTITGTSGSSTASTTIALTVNPPPSFTLAPAAGTLSVSQGTSNADTITVTSANGFAGSVTLSASGLPSGVTAAFAAGTVSGTQVMTLTASGTATIGGPVTVTITGTSGSLTASTTIALTVGLAPSFALAPAAGTLSVTQGAGNTDSIIVTPANGFSGAVTLSATGLPSGVTASFSPNPTTAGSSVLTLTASSTATTGGPVTVTITGTSGTLTASTTIALTVNVPPSFTLSPSPSSVTVIQGNSNTSTITVTGAGGFTGAVTLAATGLPSGVTLAFGTNPATSSSVVTLTASATATTGPVTVTINGTSGTLTASTTIALTVNVPPSYTLSASPPSLSVTQGSSGTSTITVTPAGGFSGAVALSATGLPSGVTASFAAGTTSTTQVLTLTANSTAATGGPVTVTINGTTTYPSGPVSCGIPCNLTASTTIALTVNAASGFTLSAAPATLSVAQGGSGTSTISVTDVGGFAGNVALAASGLPSGVTASFAAGTVAGTQVATLTASSAASAAGPVTVTIAGTSGNLTASTTIALTVTVPTITISGGSTPISIEPGATTGNTATITVTGSNGLTVNLSCSITPAAASDPPTCSLSPASVTISGSAAQTSVLTVNTTAATTAENRLRKLIWPSAGGTVLALVLIIWVPRRRRNWLAMLGLLVLFASMGAMGCGGGGSSGGGGGGGGGNSGTSPGTYTITVTGTSGAFKGTAGTVTLTVE